jgi:hypothetical protein
MTEPMSKQEVTREDAKLGRTALAKACLTIPDNMAGTPPRDANTNVSGDDLD